MDIVEELLRRAEPEGHFGVPGPPKLGVAIVTCMDARIDPVRLFKLEPGDATSCATPAASRPTT